MSTRRILLFISIPILLSIILGYIFSFNKEVPQNIFFDNSDFDSLSTIKDKAKQYEKLINDIEFFGDNDYSYEEETLKSSYTKTEMLSYPRRNDLQNIYPSEYPLNTLDYVLSIVSKMSVNCFDYDEGETCKFPLSRTWIEVQMDGDQLYINYYKRSINNFLETRDKWFNYELFINIVDDKLEFTFSISSLNNNTGVSSTSTYYYSEDNYVEGYSVGCDACNYGYFHYDYVTETLIEISLLGTFVELNYYDGVNNTYVEYSNSGNSPRFGYYVYDDKTNVFFIEFGSKTIRYDVNYVVGWDEIKKSSTEYYYFYKNDDLVTSDIDVFVSDYLAVSGYAFINYEEIELTEEIIDLSYFGLSSVITLQEINEMFDYFENNLDDLLAKYSIYRYQSQNEDLFREKIINQDDSHIYD